jgi:hypothetical protein
MSFGKAALVIGLLIGSPDRFEHHLVFVVFFFLPVCSVRRSERLHMFA